MTNHPRRVGRRKHQRHGDRNPVAHPHPTRVVAAMPHPRRPYEAYVLWGNGRIDTVAVDVGTVAVSNRPVRRRLDITLQEPA